MADPMAALLSTAMFSVPPAVLAALAFAGAWRTVRQRRQMEDVAAAPIRSAAQGYVELHGTAECAPGVAELSPLARQPCFWWWYRISECDRSIPHRRLRTVREEQYRGPFVLRDASGRCLIHPDGAGLIGQVLLSGGQSFIGSGDESQPRTPSLQPGSHPAAGTQGRYRYEERVLPAGLELYALGAFRTERLKAGQPVAELLAASRRNSGDRTAVAAPLPAEWADEIRRDGLHTLSRPDDGRPLLLSTQSQHALRDGSTMLTAALLFGGVLCASLSIWMINAALGGRSEAEIMAGLFGALLSALALLLGGGPLAAAVSAARGDVVELPGSMQRKRRSRWQIAPLLLLGLGLGAACGYLAYWQFQAAGILS